MQSVSIYTTAFKRLAVSTLLLGTLKKCAKIMSQGGILKLDLTRGVSAVLVTLHLAGCVLTLSEVQRLPFKGIISIIVLQCSTLLFSSGGRKQENKNVNNSKKDFGYSVDCFFNLKKMVEEACTCLQVVEM